MKEKIKNKAFEIFIKDLSKAYQEFCLNRIIHKKIGGKFYNNFKSTWNIILVGLEKSYLLGLARLFDKYRLEGKDKNISIYFFLDYQFINHNKTIGKLKKLRDKMLCHSDVEKMLELEKFLKKLNFRQDRGDIESLFSTTIETANQIKENFNFTQNLEEQFRQEKEIIIDKFDEWFKVFQGGISS